MEKRTIVIGSDHAAIEMKNFLIEALKTDGYFIKDMGTDSTEAVDYPDIAHPLAQLISEKSAELGILICGTGIGMSIAANQHEWVRAAVCRNKETAGLAREHNDANIICLPGRFIDEDLAHEMVIIFLSSKFEWGRHATRVDKISNF